MNTPIYDFVNKYSNSGTVRLHMPGHKGKGILNEELDITEIKGADSLFEADGIIAESEKNASLLFGSAKTLYSTQGSTLCIQTMLALATAGKHITEKPIIIAVRNAHKAFLNSCILLDLDVRWVYPSYTQGSIASGEYSSADIKKAIDECDRKPAAVYLTSPDYLGSIADIKAIADVCHKADITFLVDNAHGAYLKFLNTDIHPITLGADMCCDSAHKTLPALTSAAYLHISQNAPERFSENAKQTMAIFSSTSPSYLTLTSLDLCNRYINDNIKKDLNTIIPEIDKLKAKLNDIGYTLCGDEPLKLTIYSVASGLYGYELADILRNSNIECEYADETHIVFMFSSKSTMDDILKLTNALSEIKQPKMRIEPPYLELSKNECVMSMREAGLSQSINISIDDAIGRVCAKAVITCPPGIPVCVSGEMITGDTVKILKRYGINTVNVVK